MQEHKIPFVKAMYTHALRYTDLYTKVPDTNTLVSRFSNVLPQKTKNIDNVLNLVQCNTGCDGEALFGRVCNKMYGNKSLL